MKYIHDAAKESGVLPDRCPIIKVNNYKWLFQCFNVFLIFQTIGILLHGKLKI